MLVEEKKPEPAVDAALLAQARALAPSSPAAAVDSGTGTPSSTRAATPGALPEAAPAGPADFGQEAAMLVDFVIEGVGPMYPTIAKLYPAEVRAKIAAPLGRVFAKYDLTFLKVFMKWEPEITLAMVTVPLIAPTIQAVRIDNAAAKAAAELAKQKDKPGERAST